METRRFRPSSGEDLIAAAVRLISSSHGKKSSLKSLIWGLSSSFHDISTLPQSLHLAVSKSLGAFKDSLAREGPSSFSPPSKRPRRSSRRGGIPPAPCSKTLDLLKELRAYTQIAQLCVSHPKRLFDPADLLPAVQTLHDSIVLYEMDQVLLCLVAGICEEWWRERLPGRELLISQSLPFLLAKCLTQGKKSDVRRVYALRDAFSLFDYDDESIEDVRLLLVRCVIAPVYLKTEEGRKFIAYVLGLNGQLMKDALELIRSQISFGRKSVLEAYADIAFRVWKDSEDLLKKEIEDSFLQGLIEGAIHASSTLLAASVRRVLGKFVEQKMVESVEKLLFRVTEPVLFRSLQVANSNVRLNALHLFLDLFPLQDPSVTKEEKDNLLGKQFYLLEKLILDDCPDVRAVAVEGSCRILYLFWEVIPSSMITNILTKLVDQMLYDSCNEVRISTVKGIIYLLDNPQSHDVMKVLLPRFGRLFQDRVLSVRIAIADLLLAVRDIRALQFHKVVTLDVLLSSLANDHPAVAQRITRLLIPSYFPSKVSAKEACGRCVALIKRSPVAGARFCDFALSEGSSTMSLIELVHVCTSLVLSPKNLCSDQIDGLLIASANICRHLNDETPYRGALVKLISVVKLKKLLSAACSTLAQAAVLSMALICPPEDLSGIHEECMMIVLNCSDLSENVAKQAVVRATHKLIFSCGWFDELFDILANELQEIASSFIIKFDIEMPHKAFRPKMKKVKVTAKDSFASKISKRLTSRETEIDNKFAFSAALAWQLKDLLSNADSRNAMLRSSMLERVISSLRIISQVCIEHFTHKEFVDTTPVMAFAAFSLYVYVPNVGESAKSKTSSNKSDGLPLEVSTPNKSLLYCSMHHLLSCSEKLFHDPTSRTAKHQKCTRDDTPSGEEDSIDFSNLKSIQNVVKMATSVLKFIVDAASVTAGSNSLVRCLSFSSSYVKYVLQFIKSNHQHMRISCKQGLQNMVSHLKCSFTYMAKLLHLVLSGSIDSPSVLPIEVFLLSMDLLDLISSLELHLGSTCAFPVFCVAKPWLPTMLLGLSSYKIRRELDLSGLLGLKIPMWIWVLSKVRFPGEDYNDQNPRTDMPLFVKLAKDVVLSLRKGNLEIMNAVGCVILAAARVQIESGDYNTVFGLVKFTCVDLLDTGIVSRSEVDDLCFSLRETRSLIERQLGVPGGSTDDKKMLENAREIINTLT